MGTCPALKAICLNNFWMATGKAIPFTLRLTLAS